MSEPVFEIRNLEKRFGSHEVLRGVTLRVEPGEVVSIVGASGSGKSTLLRCVNLLETPSAGEILYHGAAVETLPLSQYRAKVGMIFQSYNLFHNMNVLENCTVGQTTVLHRSRREAEANALRYLEKVGMAPYRAARPAQLSGGQKQRVAIARALAMEPEVLLCDEPTSALDPQMVGEVLNVLRSLAGEGMTMLIVTHEMAFARDISSRGIFLENGTICEEGPALFTHPRCQKAQEFLSRFLPQGCSPSAEA